MPAYSPCVKGNPVVFRTSPQCDVYITDVALCGMGVGRCHISTHRCSELAGQVEP